MAEQLIEGMTGRWNPTAYKDEYRDDVMALVRKKVKSGQTHTIVEPEASEKEPGRAKTQVMDLLPLLKESLEAHGRGKPQAVKAVAKPRRKRSA
jgi:DNA end-binding protein Ku